MNNPFTKAYCDITFIDSITILTTISAVIGLGVLLFAVYETYFKKNK